MKTLLVKDYRILFTNKKSVIWILGIGILMLATTMEIDFLIGYMMLLTLMLSAGTINYDDFDNGMSFLMTLPVSRKTYAVEKYVLTFINSLVCGGVIFVFYLITKGFVNWGFEVGDMAAITLGWIAGICLSASAMLPLYMKFSAEKRRVVLLIFAGIIAVIVFAAQSVIDHLARDGVSNGGLLVIGDLITGIEIMSPALTLLCIFGIAILCVAVSVFISIRIMKKKEF